MKIYKFLGIALFSTLMCANLTSCNDDDEIPSGNEGQENNGGDKVEIVPVTEKLNMLTFETTDNNVHYTDTVTFVYSEEGKLASVTDMRTNKKNQEKSFMRCEYTWNEDNTITTLLGEYVDEAFVHPTESKVTLTDGKVSAHDYDGFTYKFTYDADNRLSQFSSDDEVFECRWQDGNLSSINLTEDNFFCKYVFFYDKSRPYANTYCIENESYDLVEIELALLLTAHPELIGNFNLNAVTECGMIDPYNGDMNFTFTYQGDRLPSKISANDDGELTDYAFSWNE